MTTSDTVFRFQGRHILLEDLELHYKNGKFKSKDVIEIAEDEGAQFVSYTIKTLTSLFGKEYPFRRQLRTYERDPLTAYSSDSESSSQSSSSDCESSSDAPVQELAVESEPETVFTDVPLYNAFNEPEDDRITGNEVRDEMLRMKASLPIRHFGPHYQAAFSFLNKTDGVVVVCRFCNFTPYNPRLFFSHLFSQQHIFQLTQHEISRSSFDFWNRTIEQCNREIRGESLEELVAKVREEQKEFFEQPETFREKISDILQASKEIKPELNKLWELAMYYMSEEYLEVLRSTIADESIDVRKKALSDAANVLFMRNTPLVPLFDFHLGENTLDADQRSTALLRLQDKFNCMKRNDNKAIWKVRRSTNWGANVYCFACNISCSDDHLKPVFHMFSKAHLRYLSEFGFSDSDYQWWNDRLDNLLQSSKQHTEANEIATDEQILKELIKKMREEQKEFYSQPQKFPEQLKNILESSKVFGQPQIKTVWQLVMYYKSEEHLDYVMKTDVNENADVKRKALSGAALLLSMRNDPLVPLLDFHIGPDMVDEEKRNDMMVEFEKKVKCVPSLEWNEILRSKQLASDVHCYPCNHAIEGSAKPSQLIAHIVSKKHVKYLTQFGFSMADYQWWNGLVDEYLASHPAAADKLKSDEQLLQDLIGKMREDQKEFYENSGKFQTTLNTIIEGSKVIEKPEIDTVWKLVMYYMSEEHMAFVKSTCLDKTVDLRKKALSGAALLLSMRNNPPVPLVDFHTGSDTVDAEDRSAMLVDLQEKFESVQPIQCNSTFNVICVPCNVALNCDLLNLLGHIFSQKHVDYLIGFGFSKNDYLLWNERLGEHEEKKETVETEKDEQILRRLIQEMREEQREFYSRPEEFHVHLKLILEQSKVFEKPEIDTVWKLAMYHKSEEHMQFVRSTTLDEKVDLRRKALSGAAVLLSMRNNPPVPLLDFYIGPDVVDADQRISMMTEVQKKLKCISPKEWNTAWNKKNQTFNVACVPCNVSTNCFLSPINLLEHILSQKHVDFLIECGFSKSDYVWWKNQIDEFLKKQSLPKNVPMLDLLPSHTKLTTQKQYIDTLKHIKKGLDMGGAAVEKILKSKTFNSTCGYCSGRNNQVLLENEFEVVSHILSQEHKQNMGFKASFDDCQYWRNWVEELCETAGLPREVSPKRESQPKEVSAVKPVDVFSSVPTLKSKKNRVPMVDVLPPNTKLTNSQQFHDTLKFIERIFKKGGAAMQQIAKSTIVDSTCGYCSREENVVLRNEFEVLQHILTQKHKKNMRSASSVADCEYWKKRCRILRRAALRQVSPKAESPAPMLRTDSPRIPLLDVAGPGVPQIALSEALCLKRHKALCEQLSALSTATLHSGAALNAQCHYCQSVSFATQIDVLRHVCDEQHMRNINYACTMSDFDYWELVIHQLKQPPVAVAKAEAVVKPVAKVEAVVRPSGSTTPCTLPLFATSTSSREVYVWGPTWQNLADLARLRTALSTVITFYVQAMCTVCQVSLDRMTALEVAEHAFSVKHLTAFFEYGYMAVASDFDYWITVLKSPNFKRVLVNSSDENIDCRNFKLLPLYSSTKLISFTCDDHELIRNMESCVLSRTEKRQLSSQFAGCPYCNQWIDADRIIAHYLSESHFNAIRRVEVLKEHHVSPFLKVLREHKAKEAKCICM